MYSGVISRFVEALRSGRNPTVYGDGLRSRDFTYVADVVAANLLAMNHPHVGQGEVFNIGTGRSTTLLELLDQLRAVSGNPFTVDFSAGSPGDVRHSCADITLTTTRLGYRPRHHLASGLQLLLAAFGSAGAAGGWLVQARARCVCALLSDFSNIASCKTDPEPARPSGEKSNLVDSLSDHAAQRWHGLCLLPVAKGPAVTGGLTVCNRVGGAVCRRAHSPRQPAPQARKSSMRSARACYHLHCSSE